MRRLGQRRRPWLLVPPVGRAGVNQPANLHDNPDSLKKHRIGKFCERGERWPHCIHSNGRRRRQRGATISKARQHESVGKSACERVEEHAHHRERSEIDVASATASRRGQGPTDHWTRAEEEHGNQRGNSWTSPRKPLQAWQPKLFAETLDGEWRGYRLMSKWP
jgi:hypothetical protein